MWVKTRVRASGYPLSSPSGRNGKRRTSQLTLVHPGEFT